jgi:hypothetical protein
VSFLTIIFKKPRNAGRRNTKSTKRAQSALQAEVFAS